MPDKILRIVTTRVPFRCVITWMPETAQTIFSQHSPSPKMGEYLVNSSVGALLLASNLKGSGALSLRFETSGLIGIMNADGTPEGFTRAMIVKANIEQEESGKKLRLPVLGPGFLTVSKNYNDTRKPYQGICEINSPHIGPVLADYLFISEQIKSSLSTAAVIDKGTVKTCCGFMVEALPDLKEEDLARMEENIRSLKSFRAFAQGLSRPEDLAERLLKGFPYEIIREIPVGFYCPCDRERVVRAILAAGEKEAQAMAGSKENFEVFCDYCRKRYEITPEEVRQALIRRLRR